MKATPFYKLQKGIFLIVLIFSFHSLFNSAWAFAARDIMQKVYEEDSNTILNYIQKISLSTCKYGKKGKRMICVENPDEQVFEVVKQYGKKSHNEAQTITITLKPSHRKGIGMLVYEYEDLDRETDRWLYLSALGRVKRLVSEVDDEEEESFFGSEFSNEDREGVGVHNFSFKVLVETTYQKRPVWVIEAIPITKIAKRKKMKKIIHWVDKKRLVTIKQQLYDQYGNQLRKIMFQKFFPFREKWFPSRMIIVNYETARLSSIRLIDIAFNIDIPEQFLTKRTLVDVSYREKILSTLRKHLKGNFKL